MNDVLSRIIAAVERHRLWSAGARVGVGVSGGFDSVALLAILVELAPRWNLKLTVLHANHGLRGAESDQDEAFVRSLAVSKSVECVVQRIAPPAGRWNLEERLRRLRYGFFDGVRQDQQLGAVAVAHTLDDQAETVFLHLMRGAGIAGLAGMAPRNEAGIVRPLLDVSRAELWEYLKDQGVDWREDSSNRDLRIDRNRFRTAMLPALRLWNPRVTEALARTASLARDEETYWEGEVARHFAGTWERHRLGLTGDTGSLARLPLALRRRLVRAAAGTVKGGLRDIGFEHVEQVLALAGGSGGDGAVSLPGLAVERSFDRLLIRRAGRHQGIVPQWIEIGSRVELPGTNLEVRLVQRDAKYGYTEGGMALDWGLAAQPLQIRGWVPGDKYQPVGFTRQHKVKELFQMARVPSWDRQSWPMITREDRIVWTRRFGAAAEWAAGKDAGEVVLITEAPNSKVSNFEQVTPERGTPAAGSSV